jgi:hypothetical protein
LDDTDQTAAQQIRWLLERLPAGGPLPWFVFDGGYDSAQLTLDLADAPPAVLVRLRSDRCFYADPPPRRPGATGRPRRHGAKFNCADPTTWPAPTATLACHDDQDGTVTVASWTGLHPKQQRHPGHGSRGPRPIVCGTVIRVQVERVPARTRPPKVLWLWWAGPADVQLDLDLAWRTYTRRFDLEHTVRFAKQTLGWTIPRPRHPEQADRWTWLVLAAYAQLRLARAVAGDQRLPWERPRPQPRLSPVRGRRGFPQLLVRLGTPASAPKPAGCPPGRPKGRCSGPATRYPAIKKPGKKAAKLSKAALPDRPLALRRLGQANSASHRVKSQAKRNAGETATRSLAMRRTRLVVTAVLLVLMLSFAVTGCRKSSENKGGGEYLPAPRKTELAALA